MPITERDVVLTGRDDLGQTTMDFPVTRLGLVEGDAEVKDTPEDGDYLPILDNSGMKKVPFESLQEAINSSQSVASATSAGLMSAADKKKLDGLKIFHAGTAAPADTGLLWIDTTATTGGLKYYNGTAWVHVPVATT